MKIQDLITLIKVDKMNGWMNNIKSEYFKKNGHYWNIPCHSINESILLKRYEKDCVVAYVKNKYFIAFLIKISANKFRGFCYFKDFLMSVSCSYRINDIYESKKIIDLFEKDKENLTIVEKEDYDRFKKILVLEGVVV